MSNRSYISDINHDSKSIEIAGRIMALRKMKSYRFYDIADVSGRIQLIVDQDGDVDEPMVGDVVTVTGNAVTTAKGQLSIHCSVINILSSASRDVQNAIRVGTSENMNLRAQRPLSLMIDKDLHNMVIARSLFIDIIRTHFKTGGFMEVDTPVMSYARFAGTASIFETKSRTLGKDLYLRGTLEDYLKQLVVAGYEQVFQIGDCFRNESPALMSFTMLEATWAYAESTQMLRFVQQLFTLICEELPDELVNAEMKNELSKKFEIIPFWGVLEDHFGVDIRQLNFEQAHKLALAQGYELKQSQDLDYEIAKFGYDVIKRTLAKSFKTPTFVSRFPVCISPLAKKIGDSEEADRGYGFFKGQRLFEVVGEASDYHEQMDKFQMQESRKANKDISFKHDDLLAALSYGCPPMAGLGFNINRVLAVLLDVNKTSDVVAFPLTSSALPL